MAMPKQVQNAIARVLKSESRKGETTKQSVALLAMNDLSRGGAGYGLPPAMMQVVAHRLFVSEVERQMKSGLPDNVIFHPFRNAPPELVQVLNKLPAWIATSEGAEARWVPSLKASPADWMANARLKAKKAQQTNDKAKESEDLARYLSLNGLQSLEDCYEDVAA